jgi:hypothetical protein
MPSTHDHSSGPTTLSTPRSTAPDSPGNIDPLTALAVESERAAARLVASVDWDAHDAAMAELAAASDAAMHHLMLLHQQDDAHTASSGPAVTHGTGDTTT